MLLEIPEPFTSMETLHCTEMFFIVKKGYLQPEFF